MKPAPAPIDPPFGAYAPTPRQAGLIRLARGSFLKRGDFRKLMVGLILKQRKGPVDFTFRGANFRLDLTDNTSGQAVLLNAEYNAGELGFLEGVLTDGGTFVDVGANIGLFTVPLAFKAAKVLAVEADPLVLARLNANLAANALTNVTVAPVAVGDATGEVSFIRDAANLGHSRVGEGGTVTVPMRPLLDVLRDAGLDRIDAFKIDVEGFEDKVLDPFFATAPKSLWPRRVVIEKLHAGVKDTPVDRMKALGYVERGGNRANLFLERG